MFKKIKLFSLLFGLLVFNNQISAKMSTSKKILLGAGSAVTIGYLINKAYAYYPYLEINQTFDAKTSRLLARIEAKFRRMLNLLDGYDYQTPAQQQTIDRKLAKLIDLIYVNNREAFLQDFEIIQEQVELRFNRLNNWWFNNDYLYHKWYDKLLAASADLYELERWVERFG